MTDPVVYTMAILKDGEVIATKKVRTYLEGCRALLAEPGQLKEIEFAWALRGRELAQDILHYEGRFDQMRDAQKAGSK